MLITTALIVPARNEEATIFSCIKELRRAFPVGSMLYVVDNGSTDATASIAQSCKANLMHIQEPGKGFAVHAGIAKAFNEGAQWFVLHDADCEYDAQDVSRLLDECKRQYKSDTAVMGVGLRQVELGKVLWRSVFANWFTRKMLKLATGKEAPCDILTGARVFNRAAIILLFNHKLRVLEGFELETGLTKRALVQDIPIVTAPVRYTPRAATEKKISALDMLPITLTALRRAA